jgi:hypothetical protein
MSRPGIPAVHGREDVNQCVCQPLGDEAVRLLGRVCNVPDSKTIRTTRLPPRLRGGFGGRFSFNPSFNPSTFRVQPVRVR